MILVSVDPTLLFIRTLIEAVAGIILVYLVYSQRRMASLFLEMSIVCAVVDRAFILMDPSPILTHDILTTASSVFILLTVIARAFEDEKIRTKFIHGLREPMLKEIQDSKDEKRKLSH